jgi:nuclear GTP-binding protein
MKKSGT